MSGLKFILHYEMKEEGEGQEEEEKIRRERRRKGMRKKRMFSDICKTDYILWLINLLVTFYDRC